MRRHIASIFLAEDLIDFCPKVSMEEGLKKTVEWYKHQTRINSIENIDRYD